MSDLSKNIIYYGDNLKFLRDKDEFPSNYVDFIYLDPPFNSKKAYNIIYDEDRSQAQVEAFDDTWHWSQETQRTYDELLQGDRASARVKQTIKSFHDMLGDNNLMAYLVMMTPRLIELKRVLKESGSIYLHCDPTASHYLKIIMDAIFGKENFRNELVWKYSTGGYSKSHFGRKHDIILFYTKTDEYEFYPEKVKIPREEGALKRAQNPKGARIDKDDKLKLPEDVLNIQALNPMANERVGYPTQKPEELVQRLIKASCPEDGIVLDPFCGCGTTLIASEKLDRKWIGIDITYLAVDVLKQRIEKDFNEEEDVDFEIKGEPEGMAGAERLAEENKSEFQKWIISKIGGTPNEDMSGDEGIDGFLYFKDGGKDRVAIIQETVSKSVSPGKVRDFKGTMERDNAPMGVFITMKEPTKGMKKEANTAGTYEDSFGNEYPRIQFITVEEIMEGEKPDIPQIKSHVSKRDVKDQWEKGQEEDSQTTLS